jgi:hypothetical protein
VSERQKGSAVTRAERFDGLVRITIAVDGPAPSAEALELALIAATNAARGALVNAGNLGIGSADDRGSNANVERRR